MKIALCTATDTISHLWSNYLKDTKHKTKIIKDKDALMDFLSNYPKGVVCIEDIWPKNTIGELIFSLKEWYPKVRIFVLSQQPNFSEGMKLLGLGAKAYANARLQEVHFIDALRNLKRGDAWLYPEFVQMMIKNINITTQENISLEDKINVLSKREQEIAKLIHKGYTNQEIADITNITLRTVKAHSSSIYEKLGVKDRVALVLYLNTVS